MPELMAAVKEALAGQGWVFSEPGRDDVLEMQFEAHHTRVPLHIQAFESVGALHVVSRSGFEFPASHLPVLMELLLRASAGLTVGNFELDWAARRPLVRIANLFEPGRIPDPRLVAGMVQAAVTEMDRMTPLLAALHRTAAPDVASFPVEVMLRSEDWLPPVPEDPTHTGP